MKSVTNLRPSTAFAVAAMALLSACASDNAGSPLTSTANEVSAVVLGQSNSFVATNNATNTFELYTADQQGRYEGAEFWDNISDDGLIAGSSPIRGCAIGFYALDRMTVCNTWEKPGSTANAAGNAYTYMFSDGVKAASFEFKSGASYTVSFRGAYSRDNSFVGYYVEKGGVKVFTEVVAWTTKVLPSASVEIDAGTGSWGFFIANDNVVGPGCGVWKGKKAACSDATGGHVMDPLQQFALFGNRKGTSYLVGAEDRSVDLTLKNDSDYNDYIWTVVPTPDVCDFVTFGRTKIETKDGKKIVVSGNAGGRKADGSFIGSVNVRIDGTSYRFASITSYGAITSGPLSGARYGNARRIVGVTTSGQIVEIRVYDGGEGRSRDDAVYVRIGSSEPLGASGAEVDRGNIQYHDKCRGPGSDDEDDDDEADDDDDDDDYKGKK